MNSEKEAEGSQLRNSLKETAEVIGGWCLFTVGVGVAVEPIIYAMSGEEAGPTPAGRVIAGAVTAVTGMWLALGRPRH